MSTSHSLHTSPDSHQEVPHRGDSEPTLNLPSRGSRSGALEGAVPTFASASRWASKTRGDDGIGWHFRFSELPSDPELLAICEALSRYIG